YRRISFFVVPCVGAFLALGGVIAAAIFQTGAFGLDDSRYVWGILAGTAVGLVPATLARLTASASYAMGDTRAPVRAATVRVVLAAGLGYVAATRGPGWLGLDLAWGAALLTAVSGSCAWLEFAMLRRMVGNLVGRPRIAAGQMGILAAAAAAAAGAGWLGSLAAAGGHPVLVAVAALAPFAAVYGALTLWAGIPEARQLVDRIRRD
ncbi:MAG TPA: lipid II flippase MurJ, partial [Gemmatimonadales bacterium]|nr:lipid II flippase MurJ [Gemmatimonadales bacterium]